MTQDTVKMDCPTFRKQESVIRDITDIISRAALVVEKARYAEELQKETDVLLSCSDYKPENRECQNCRFIAVLRHKTAQLIIKAKELA